jgi:plasmid stabilization system protein ParE
VSKSRRETRVQLTQRALGDLREAEQFSIREWGRKTAVRYLDDIAKALDRLQEDPEILRLEPDFAPGLYFYRVKKHFLVCDYQDDFIIVLTVIHTSMDLPARLLELEPRLATETQMLRTRLHRSTAEKD